MCHIIRYRNRHLGLGPSALLHNMCIATSVNDLNINIPIYIQQDATLHSLFYLETALHVSDGTTTHQRESKQLYLQHLLFVTPLLLNADIVEELEPV